MSWRSVEIALWLVGSVLIAVLYLGATNHWPWIALSGVLFLLAAIALGARRRMPFG